MKNKLFLGLSLIAIAVAELVIANPASADPVCRVTDPTGTPLNVRDLPNGRVINSLKNGREVYIEQLGNDDLGRPWVEIGGYYQGRYRVWGWVLREFISCYDR